MKLSKYFVAGMLILTCSFSCKKHDPSPSGGGKGGNATLLVNPQAHGTYIDTCTVYIKYGTLDAPASGIFDDSDSVKIINGIPTATFSNLKTGIYYILGKGYHTGFTEPYVKGATPVTISSESTVTTIVQVGSYTP